MRMIEPSITCPVCWRTSYHPKDISEGYCGKCHAWTQPPKFVGLITPDFIGTVLQLGYYRFNSPLGIDGLMKWKDNRLDLLALFARVPRAGQLRQFIAQAKLDCQIICVWHIWNPIVAAALLRYGFTEETEIQGNGEPPLTGFRWDKS